MQDSGCATSAAGWTFDGGNVVIDAERSIVRVFLRKRDELTCTRMRSFGFRWSPAYHAWWRYATPNALRDARKATGC